MIKIFLLLVCLSTSVFANFVPFTVSSKSMKNVDIQAVYFGTGANCASVCSTGTCTICRQSGSKITSVTFVSAGTYDVNGIDGTKYTCTGSANNASTAASVLDHDGNSTSSLRRVQCYNGGSPTNCSQASIICIGHL